MSTIQIHSILDQLEILRSQPHLFVGSESRGMWHFLNGFDLAAGAISVDVDYPKLREATISERGWGTMSSIYEEISLSSKTEEDIVKELINIHIETWKKVLASIE